MIYFASPYTHQDPLVREQRYRDVSAVTARLIKIGLHIFCPITYSHVLAVDYDLSGTWDFWMEFDTAFIDLCDRVYVYELDGWKESLGVSAEIAYAKKTDKPVYGLSLSENGYINIKRDDGLIITYDDSVTPVQQMMMYCPYVPVDVVNIRYLSKDEDR